MNSRILFIIVFLLHAVHFYARKESLTVRRDFWMQQLNDQKVVPERRVAYADSLIGSYKEKNIT